MFPSKNVVKEIEIPNNKYIPFGKYIDIDEKYYKDVGIEVNTKYRSLKPHGHNVKYNPSEFVIQSPPLSLQTGSLKVNYGSYMYNQHTGYDDAHNRFEKTQPVLNFN